VSSGVSTKAKLAVFLAVIGLVFLASHLPFIAPGPGTVDAMNFALGVREFDPGHHQPHPPGYPVFIALGKITRPVVALGSAATDSVSSEARALAIWSAIFGAIAVFPLFIIFKSLELDDRRGAAATVLTVVCPLFWFTAVRGMSDIPGLSVACMAQAVLLAAHRRQRSSGQPAWRLVLVGAIVSGLAIGLRSQTMWLTIPVLIVVTIGHLRGPFGSRSRWTALVACAFVAGVLLWAVPLMAATGGLKSYFGLLEHQAALDRTDSDMLVLRPSVGRLAAGVIGTFGYPWANAYLAGVVLLLAIVGFTVMAWRSRAALGWLAVACGPYLVFHLLFQDPSFSRYALPTIPAVAYLVVRGLERLSSRALPALVGSLAAACLIVAAPPVVLYGARGGTGYQAMTSVRLALERGTAVPPVVAAHQEVGLATRGERIPTRTLPFPRGHEWLEVVKYWRDGGAAPVWFLADSGRTDLALIDPSARTLRQAFQLPFTNRYLLRGARPTDVSWYQIEQPGWMVGEGWALTPEAAGVAWRDGRSPGARPITAWIRRRSEPAVMILGGRNLGRPGEPDVRFEAAIDGRPIASWTVAPEPGFFLRVIDLPGGTLEGSDRYAALTISAQPSDGVIRHVNAAIEQFDVQSTTRPVFGFGDGWYQLEFDPKARRLWRWTGPWAALRVNHAGRDLTLRISGDSPLNYLDRVPNITVRAGDRVLGQLAPAASFVVEVPVPADAVERAHGEILIESDVTFVPDDRLHNGDRRPLGLRIFDVSLSAAGGQ
jgi:hypothetical protein